MLYRNRQPLEIAPYSVVYERWPQKSPRWLPECALQWATQPHKSSTRARRGFFQPLGGFFPSPRKNPERLEKTPCQMRGWEKPPVGWKKPLNVKKGKRLEQKLF